MGKRRIVEDSESEFHSESMRSKQKKLGKENIDSPLPSKQLFAQEEGTKQRSSDSNGGSGGPRKTGTMWAITPYPGVPRRKRNVKNMSTPAALNRIENSYTECKNTNKTLYRTIGSLALALECCFPF
jgi:hypothetical protein